MSRKSLSFEAYVYYASATRSAEQSVAAGRFQNRERTALRNPSTKEATAKPDLAGGLPPDESTPTSQRDEPAKNEVLNPVPYLSSLEADNAAHSARVATWGSVAYLIVTDIFGPSQAPWSFAQMGHGPGFLLYTAIGGLSTYSGWLLWKIFIGLDAEQHPIRNYADIFERLFGTRMKHFVNISQVIQLMFVQGLVILISGQSISQMSYGVNGDQPGLCFIVCLLVFTLAGFLVGQIRTLRKVGWLASVSVWFNLLVIILVMVLAAKYPPNFAAIEATFGPQWQPAAIQTFAWTPPDGLATGGSGCEFLTFEIQK
ncbi:hypothetical protein JX266_006164 [Neoarthrinium moseri]|nr:hypothetical protein JX266_006164 [Neoarthrinium moseri]